MPARVIIIGGGVAGLSAAHELVRRGFEVDVYEAERRPGGKARSFPGPGLGGPNEPLPAEHGFRFFPGFYRHIVRTMSEIPVFATGRTVDENLVDLPVITIGSYSHDLVRIPTRFSFNSFMNSFESSLGLASVTFQPGEIEFYATRIWQILTSCRERRVGEYEKIGWWEFIDADSKSLNYQKYLANLPRLLVAADPKRVSTKTNGDVVVQLYLDVLRRRAVDQILNGPTNQVWLYPWLKYLIDQGVRYFVNAEVTAIALQAGKVSSIELRPTGGVGSVERVEDCDSNGPQTAPVSAAAFVVGTADDYFIAAVPVEKMAELLYDTGTNTWSALAQADTTLQRIVPLSQNVDWMNGIMFYLSPAAPRVEGHTIYVDPFRVAPNDPQYAVTSICQGQYWQPAYNLTNYADGSVGDILSVDVSDWGNLKKGVPLADVPEIVWGVVKTTLQNTPNPITDAHRIASFVDPAIEEVAVTGQVRLTNKTPLLVNLVDTWHMRPHAYTGIDNFMLASDYVRTHTDLATMEGANEAARYAVNCIIEREGMSGRAKTWKLHEPRVLAIYRWIDKRRYRKGLPWEDQIPWFMKLVNWVWQFISRILP